MARYQEGGLAVATGDDPDEQEDPSMVSSYGDRAREISKMTREKALGRLQSGYDELSQQKYDRSQKWLALAQGMLAPTRTGGFGESLGASAGLLREEGKEQRQFEQNRAERLARMEAEMADREESYADREIDILGEEGRRAIQLRARLQVNAPTAHQFTIRGADGEEKVITGSLGTIVDPIGGDVTTYSVIDPGTGLPALRITTMDPAQAGSVKTAEELAKLSSATLSGMVNQASVAKPRLAMAYRALELLDHIEAQGGATGGFGAWTKTLREWFGDNAPDVADVAELEHFAANQAFQVLQDLNPGQLSEGERAWALSMAAGGRRPIEVNRRLMRDLVRRSQYEIDTAKNAAWRKDYDKYEGIGLMRDLVDMPMPDYGQTSGGPKLQGPQFTGGGPQAVAEGEMGSLSLPHEPATMGEAALLMKDTQRTGQFVKAPPDHPTAAGKVFPIQ